MTELEGPVDVVLRRVPCDTDGQDEDIFDFIAKLPPGNRSKEAIDRQIREERKSLATRKSTKRNAASPKSPMP